MQVPPAQLPSVERWSDLEPEQMNPLLTRQFITGSQAMLARIVMKKGCGVPEHSHANEQIVFILEGALRFELAGEERIVRSGEMLVIPSNIPTPPSLSKTQSTSTSSLRRGRTGSTRTTAISASQLLNQ